MRLESLQALRAIAALAVVVFHIRVVELKFLPEGAVLDALARYMDAGVDLFFVLSGFVMTTITAGRYGRQGATADFLVRRAWRVLPVYWLFLSLLVAKLALSPGLAASGYTQQDILASYLLIPQAKLPVLGVGWTLVHEAYFYIVFAVAIAFVPERAVPLYLFTWGAAVTLGHFTLEASPAQALATNPLTYEFIAGALLGLYWRRIPAWLGLPLLLAGCVLALAAGALLPAEGPENMSVWTRVGVFGIASALLVAGAVVLERRGRLPVPRWLSALGDASYSLYLSHIFVIFPAGRIWANVMPSTSWANHAAFALAITALACGVALAAYRWIEQPLLALPKRLARSATARS